MSLDHDPVMTFLREPRAGIEAIDPVALVRTAQRRVHRRQAAVTCAAALLVGGTSLVAVTGGLHLRAREGRSAAVPQETPRVHLVRPDTSLLTAALNPGWLPSELRQRGATVRFGLTDVRFVSATHPTRFADLSTAPSDLHRWESRPGSSTVIDVASGRHATMWLSGTQRRGSLAWHTDQGIYVLLQVGGFDDTERILRRIAESLTVKPLTSPPPFEMSLAPQGWTITDVTESAVHWSPPGADFTQDLVLSLRPETEADIAAADRAGLRLDVPQSGGRVLSLRAAAGTGITADDLRAIAAGVRVHEG